MKQGGVAITGVRGMGGAGKTELARRLAAELKADYPDAQIELDLKGVSPQPLSPADVLSAILRAFRPTAQLPERAEELAALLRQTLDGHRALLLLDNAKDARQIAPLLPPPPGCLVLVTSRQHFAVPGLDAVNLGVMEPPEARALLLKIAPRIGPEADALAEACGRLPLALRLAASFLAVNEHIAPADYLRQLRDSRQRLRLLDKARELTAEDLGLEASFTLSFQQLPTEQQQRFTQLAVFPESFDRAAVTAVWAVEESTAGDALDLLLRLSLLEWNRESQRFELHDLLREFARNRARPRTGPDDTKARGAFRLRGGCRHRDCSERRGEGSCPGSCAVRPRAGASGGGVRLARVAKRQGIRPTPHLVGDTRGFHTRPALPPAPAHPLAGSAARSRPASSETAGGKATPWAISALPTPLWATRAKPSSSTSRRWSCPRGWRPVAGKARSRQSRHCLRRVGRCAARLLSSTSNAWPLPARQATGAGKAAALGNLGNAHHYLGDAQKAIGFYEQPLAIGREIGDWLGEAPLSAI